MALFLKKTSVTAKQTADRKIHLRSKEFPCFSKIPFATRPFFKQWYIHTVDVTKIMFICHAEAKMVMEDLRSHYGKSKRNSITVDEFCAFTGISKSYVRMHLVSRLLEQEIKAECANATI
jgi:hypothetical protein